MSQKMYLLVYKSGNTDANIDFDFLKEKGIDLVYATNMKSMSDMMREREAAAVMAFYESEEKNAIDFLRYIMRQHPNTQRIYLTDHLKNNLIENAVNKAHINYLLILPPDLNHLSEIINKAFRRYKFLTRPMKRYDDLAGITVDLLEHVDKYKNEANTDSLTRLFNRRSFDKILDKAMVLFKENNLHFSLVILDLDDFKKLNDTYGHQAGDEVLRVFGSILQKNMRQEDSAFRYGGEEFAVIASGDKAENIKLFIERIRNQVINEIITFEGKKISFTFSAGVACIQKSFSKDDLIHASDQALYYAKEHGKDQIIVYEEIAAISQ
jgi:diguanylate cyclase (GGDEF)-like protein